jgi:arylformamidase
MCRVSRLSLGVHTGTHVDAPNHFDVPGGGVDALPLGALLGAARVVAVQGKTIDRADVESLDLQAGDRVLFKTSNSARCWTTDEFVADYVYVTEDAARHLASRRVGLVGVDYLSLGGPVDGVRAHRVLFEAGVCILEGLDLRGVAAGDFDLVALPLLIPGSDGAPARVLLRPR